MSAEFDDKGNANGVGIIIPGEENSRAVDPITIGKLVKRSGPLTPPQQLATLLLDDARFESVSGDVADKEVKITRDLHISQRQIKDLADELRNLAIDNFGTQTSQSDVNHRRMQALRQTRKVDVHKDLGFAGRGEEFQELPENQQAILINQLLDRKFGSHTDYPGVREFFEAVFKICSEEHRDLPAEHASKDAEHLAKIPYQGICDRTYTSKGRLELIDCALALDTFAEHYAEGFTIPSQNIAAIYRETLKGADQAGRSVDGIDLVETLLFRQLPAEEDAAAAPEVKSRKLSPLPQEWIHITEEPKNTPITDAVRKAFAKLLVLNHRSHTKEETWKVSVQKIAEDDSHPASNCAKELVGRGVFNVDNEIEIAKPSEGEHEVDVRELAHDLVLLGYAEDLAKGLNSDNQVRQEKVDEDSAVSEEEQVEEVVENGEETKEDAEQDPNDTAFALYHLFSNLDSGEECITVGEARAAAKLINAMRRGEASDEPVPAQAKPAPALPAVSIPTQPSTELVEEYRAKLKTARRRAYINGLAHGSALVVAFGIVALTCWEIFGKTNSSQDKGGIPETPRETLVVRKEEADAGGEQPRDSVVEDNTGAEEGAQSIEPTMPVEDDPGQEDIDSEGSEPTTTIAPDEFEQFKTVPGNQTQSVTNVGFIKTSPSSAVSKAARTGFHCGGGGYPVNPGAAVVSAGLQKELDKLPGTIHLAIVKGDQIVTSGTALSAEDGIPENLQGFFQTTENGQFVLKVPYKAALVHIAPKGHKEIVAVDVSE